MRQASRAIARYIVLHSCAGFALGLLFGVAILSTDCAGIGSLVAASAHPAQSTAIFLIGSVTTFLPIVIATAVGLLSSGKPD